MVRRRRLNRRRRHPSSRGVGASRKRNAHLRGEADCAAASPSSAWGGQMFGADEITWMDFEVASALDLKDAGTLRYADDCSTRAIVLAYAIGNGPVRIWHADGTMLDWDNAPDDLRAAFTRGGPFAAWNAGFDSAVW